MRAGKIIGSRAARNRILEWPERRGEIGESSFAPPTSKGTSRMTIATRVLETILPIEPVPAGDRCSRARFEKMKCRRGGPSGAHERQQALVRAFVPPQCALSRGPNLAAGNKPSSHGVQCAHAP